MESLDGNYTYYNMQGGQPIAIGRFVIKNGELAYPSEQDERNLGRDFPEGPVTDRTLHQIVYLETHSGYAFLKKEQ